MPRNALGLPNLELLTKTSHSPFVRSNVTQRSFWGQPEVIKHRNTTGLPNNMHHDMIPMDCLIVRCVFENCLYMFIVIISHLLEKTVKHII